MPSRLEAVPLTRETARQIFPLAQSVMPDLGIEAWLTFARRQGGDPADGGILGIRDERGYFLGLFDYRVRRDLAGAGPTLEVALATAMDLVDRNGAAALLVKEIETLAAGLGCHATQIRLRPKQRRLRRSFERAGHELEAVVLTKSVGSATR